MRIKYELNYFLAAALIRLRKLTNNRCNYVGRWNELNNIYGYDIYTLGILMYKCTIYIVQFVTLVEKHKI